MSLSDSVDKGYFMKWALLFYTFFYSFLSFGETVIYESNWSVENENYYASTKNSDYLRLRGKTTKSRLFNNKISVYFKNYKVKAKHNKAKTQFWDLTWSLVANSVDGDDREFNQQILDGCLRGLKTLEISLPETIENNNKTLMMNALVGDRPHPIEITLDSKRALSGSASWKLSQFPGGKTCKETLSIENDLKVDFQISL